MLGVFRVAAGRPDQHSIARLFGEQMAAALQFWVVDLPWWGWLIALLLIVLLAYFAWVWRQDSRLMGGEDFGEEPESSQIVVPYYAETESLRDLGNDLKLDVPTARQVTRSKRLSIGFKGTSGEGGQSETAEFAETLPLPRLAKALEEPVRYEGIGPATDAADAPLVSDEGVLSGAIQQIKSELPGRSETAELLDRVQEAYGTERVEAMAGKKRREFEVIGKRNQLMVVRGQFGLLERGGEGIGPKLRLTHFNPTPAYIAASMRARGGEEIEADLIAIPDGVGLHVTLPDATALTPAGRERLHRGQPVYVGLIAHSPSFDEESGILTCSAWALWGETMPDWDQQTSEYRYYR
jgi:hypothetical protein